MATRRFKQSSLLVVGLFSTLGVPCCGGKVEKPLASELNRELLPETGGAPAVDGDTGWQTSAGQSCGTGGSSTGGDSGMVGTGACARVHPPSAVGSLAVAGEYVTTGNLRGFVSTWVGDKSLETTCVVPRCQADGCAPAFSSTALCTAGFVPADMDYLSGAGVGLNLNQTIDRAEPRSVEAPAAVVVYVDVYDDAFLPVAATGNLRIRVAINDASGVTYCVDSYRWSNGVAIPISEFQIECWDPGSNSPRLREKMPITRLDLYVASDAVAENPFSFCLTGLVFE